jgi:mannosyltransferase
VVTEKTGDSFGSILDRFFAASVGLILMMGLLFRLPGLSSRSLWIDELYAEWFASRSFTELWRDVPFYEMHPPVYYTALKLWTGLFGNSELGLRSLSLVASMATILAVAISGRFMKASRLGEGVGLLAAALLAVNYANIREAQNARPYSLQILFCTSAIIASLVLVVRLSRPKIAIEPKGTAFVPTIMLGVFAGCALWIHNTSIFIVTGIWAGLALSLCATPADMRLRNFAVFFAAGLLALAIWAPYLPLYVEQSRKFMGLGFWLEPKTRDLYSAWLLLLGEGWPALSLGIALLALGLFRLGRCSPALAIAVAAILFLPLFTVLAVTFAVKPIYIQRLFAWTVPLGLVVIAFAILTATRRKWPRLILAVLVAGVAAASSIRDFDRPTDDWKAIVNEIARNARPGDVVIAAPAEGSIAIDYYARRQAHFPPIVCVPGCYPQRGLPRAYGSNLGAPKVVEADRQIVDQALKTHGRVWLVQVSVQLYDPKNIVRSRIGAARTFVRYYGNSLARVDLFE